MNNRDCESCKKFSRNDSQEGEDCKMYEFTLHSATKYKDGTPMMVEPETSVSSSNQLDYLERVFKEFAKTQDELIEEYDETLKTHGDTLEDHTERIAINEGNIDAISSYVEELQRKIYQIYQFLNSLDPDFFAKIQDEKFVHKCTDFCGNCTHASHASHVASDIGWVCDLSGEIVDPDDSSCSMFEPPF